MTPEIATSIEIIEKELERLRRLCTAGIERSGAASVVSLREAERRLNKSPRTILRHAVRDGAATKNGGGRWQVDMSKLSLKVPQET